MPLEKGGRADKAGNRYEIKWTVLKLLEVLDEKLKSVIIEPIGENEEKTDVLIKYNDNTLEHQQCKSRNKSLEYWRLGDLKDIPQKWKEHLDKDSKRKVSLVSAVNFTYLEDLNKRALNTSGEADEFYQSQILNTNKDFQGFYKDICQKLGLIVNEDNKKYESNVLRSIDYLKRIKFYHMSNKMIEKEIEYIIKENFINKKEEIYSYLLSFIFKKEIWGKEITQSDIFNFLKQYENVEFKKFGQNEKILPCFENLNKQYKNIFKPIKEKLIDRKEFEEAINTIKEMKSLVIHGKAGYGKSGCTEAVIKYCETANIPYIAIKLDKFIPSENLSKWCEKLGLPKTVPESLHQISGDKRSIIILDQLDALRWTTQSNSYEAISICMELINQVKELNKNRNEKISIIIVSRTYNLDNDNNIKLLFQNDKDYWKKIEIKKLEDSQVKEIIGKKYELFSKKLKEILKIPSNLSIWQNLNIEEDYNNITTTGKLIEKWYKQLCDGAEKSNLKSKDVEEVKNLLINDLEKRGRLYSKEKIFNRIREGLNYLSSSGLLIIQNEKVSFFHQSILDYFVVENMIEKYLNKEDMINIIGEKIKQTPNRRYQVQMFMQSLLEEDSQDFLDVGEKILENQDIRYFIKYVFYEILNQISEIDDDIKEYIIKNCEREDIFDD